jgi:4-amino-4-deoxy-L-arabinose transferase-like glycosyltransferase
LGNPKANLDGLEVMAKWGPSRILTLMRLGILPFFLLACAVVYIWTRHYFGGPVGVFALAFVTLTLQVLGDAGLATTDMALAACLGAAFVTLLLWAEAPTWIRSVLLGCSSALAALSKFTALTFLPAAAVLAFLGYLLIRRPGLRRLLSITRARLLPFAAAVLTGALIIWLDTDSHSANSPAGTARFQRPNSSMEFAAR